MIDSLAPATRLPQPDPDQARARRAHYQRREQHLRLEYDPPAFDTLTVDCSVSGASVDEWAF